MSLCVCQSAPVRALVVPVCCERGLHLKNSSADREKPAAAACAFAFFRCSRPPIPMRKDTRKLQKPPSILSASRQRRTSSPSRPLRRRRSCSVRAAHGPCVRIPVSRLHFRENSVRAQGSTGLTHRRPTRSCVLLTREDTNGTPSTQSVHQEY